jgi:tetratricopeptide (TPR) repeat protein
VHSELGAALEQQERYSEALAHYQQRYTLSKTAGDEKGVSAALANSAGMMWRLGDYDGATNALKEATTIADKPTGGYKAVLAAIYQYEGELELSQRHFAEAIKRSDDAIAAAGDQYIDIVVRAKRVAGLAKSFSGNKGDGRKLCDESAQLASKTQDPRLIATSSLALAEAMLLNGDAKSAINLISGLIDNFARANQWDSEWRACVIAARASEESGDPAKAREYSTRAKETLGKLEQRFGADAFKQYLTRQDLQSYQQQVAAISN